VLRIAIEADLVGLLGLELLEDLLRLLLAGERGHCGGLRGPERGRNEIVFGGARGGVAGR